MTLTLTNAAKCAARRRYAIALNEAAKRKQILRAGKSTPRGFLIGA